jgi:hypothetical protein
MLHAHSHHDDQAPVSASSDFVKRYVGIISLVSSLLIAAIFWGFYERTVLLIEDQLLHEARAFFQEIVETRHWILEQQGVYVKRQPGMQPDPNLEMIKGLKTIITDREGEQYLLRNHAAITKMISETARQEHRFALNITSLKPLNPDNQPDGFERTALESFETGEQEYYQLKKTRLPCFASWPP